MESSRVDMCRVMLFKAACTAFSWPASTRVSGGREQRYGRISIKIEQMDWAGEGLPDGAVKDGLKAQLCQGRALDVLVSIDLSGALAALLVCDGSHLLLGQLADFLGIITLI